MWTDFLQQSPPLVKQTSEETSPSASVGWPPFSQPVKIAPRLLSGTHWVGIFVPASPTKRYHFPNIKDEESSSHFLHRWVCCKYSFCQHHSGFCNFSKDRLKSLISVNAIFCKLFFIRKLKEKKILHKLRFLKRISRPVKSRNSTPKILR